MSQLNKSPRTIQAARKRPENARVRFRELAETLGVSEAELTATKCGETAQRLRPDALADVMLGLNAFETQMGLSRNRAAVSELDGNLPQLSRAGNILCGENNFCYLSYDVSAWKSGFAIVEPVRGKVRPSLHFFDETGEAVHKRYLPENFSTDFFKDFIAPFVSENQSIYESVAPPIEKFAPPYPALDSGLLAGEWETLAKTGDFCTFWEKTTLSRYDMARLLSETEYATLVSIIEFREICARLKAEGVIIQIEVQNSGAFQRYKGPLTRVADVESWFNFLEPLFNLHLSLPEVSYIYQIRRPTPTEDLYTIEIYDVLGELLALIKTK